MSMSRPSELSSFSLRMIELVDRIVLFISKHWLGIAVLGLFVFQGLPWLAPVLMNVGLTEPAGWIYFAYGLTCHQLSYRSFFLFGDQAAYTLPDLQTHLHVDNSALDLFFWRAFNGDAVTGYKVAYCERDAAIYGTFLLALIGFGILRRIRPLQPLSLRVFLLVFVPPIAIDGITQLLGFRESNALLRTLTGFWFALGAAWLVLPQVDAAMRDLYAQTAYQLERVKTRKASSN